MVEVRSRESYGVTIVGVRIEGDAGFRLQDDRCSGPRSSRRAQVRVLQHPSTWGLFGSKALYDVVFGPDGRWLATASQDKTARIWDAGSGQQLHTLNDETWVWAVAFSPDGGSLATGTGGNRALLWTLRPPSRQ